MTYTGSLSTTTDNASAPFVAGFFQQPLAQFSNYDIHSLDVRSISVDVQNETVETELGGEYTFSLASIDPSAVVENSTALQGNYHGTDESGALVFGKIEGSATVIAAEQNSAVITPSSFAPNPDGSPSSVFVSPLAVGYDVLARETTRLDENGLSTQTVSVTDGINMNGSRITNLGSAVNAGDAVNLGQVVELIATNSPIQNSEGDGSLAGGSGSSASGNGAVALGQGQQANGNGAVALGDPNIATGTGAVAIGADNTATGNGAVAIGDTNRALGNGAVAIGVASNANGAGNVAIGDSAEARAANSVALGANSLADRANTVSVGAAGAERRVVNVANAISDTDAVNKAQLDTETQQRLAADAVLVTGIRNETTARVAGDAGLQRRIVNESAVRAAADTAEANARAAADGRLQTQINGLTNSMFSLTGRVGALERTVSQDRKDSRQGIAAAVAMTPAAMPSAPGKVAYTVNVANFRDEQAVAASLAMRLRGPNPLAVTAGIAYGGGANTAVRVGVAGEF
ncbi:YadA-like family protein [Novosphingobium sp. MMS21-SN21R]|uniref:YadA-like family protein n=1 Tax=Novosphingobium sp. MMS21-SN21R TaxID=2969298 RepID=UPI00288749DC|nr:YadA-like family protein [Novosphingobium sp. MMS21-SN21R]MDT0508206.1 YadA-like family protein [Novosphingobium sp. MMS21-SN21R]